MAAAELAAGEAEINGQMPEVLVVLAEVTEAQAALAGKAVHILVGVEKEVI